MFNNYYFDTIESCPNFRSGGWLKASQKDCSKWKSSIGSNINNLFETTLETPKRHSGWEPPNKKKWEDSVLRILNVWYFFWGSALRSPNFPRSRFHCASKAAVGRFARLHLLFAWNRLVPSFQHLVVIWCQKLSKFCGDQCTPVFSVYVFLMKPICLYN